MNIKNKIITVEQAVAISEHLHESGKKVVVTGGCFDILHTGHIQFLGKAKEYGDSLFVLLEDDERIKKLKGEQRPFNTQGDRATVLSAMLMVDYVVLLEHMNTDTAYDEVISQIKPAIIATTAGDPYRFHKERQAGNIQGQVVDVIGHIGDYSTSKIADNLSL